MGSDAEVFIFDYDAYVNDVVPAFWGLLRDRGIPDWLQPLLKRRELKPHLWDKDELASLFSPLHPDLSWIGSYDFKWTYDEDWQHRWTSAMLASEGKTGPPSPDLVEQVTWLFKVAVSVKCLGDSQFVGRSATTSDYSNALAEMGVRDGDPVFELLAALGKRGFIIGYQFGAGFEGINGWIQPSEAATLARLLDALPLPRYDVSFTAMERFRSPDTGAYESSNFSFEALSLSFVRTTAAIAAREGHGLLWGNNLMPSRYDLELSIYQ